jgi:hypothetical protein
LIKSRRSQYKPHEGVQSTLQDERYLSKLTLSLFRLLFLKEQAIGTLIVLWLHTLAPKLFPSGAIYQASRQFGPPNFRQ